MVRQVATLTDILATFFFPPVDNSVCHAHGIDTFLIIVKLITIEEAYQRNDITNVICKLHNLSPIKQNMNDNVIVHQQLLSFGWHFM